MREQFNHALRRIVIEQPIGAVLRQPQPFLQRRRIEKSE